MNTKNIMPTVFRPVIIINMFLTAIASAFDNMYLIPWAILLSGACIAEAIYATCNRALKQEQGQSEKQKKQNEKNEKNEKMKEDRKGSRIA